MSMHTHLAITSADAETTTQPLTTPLKTTSFTHTDSTAQPPFDSTLSTKITGNSCQSAVYFRFCVFLVMTLILGDSTSVILCSHLLCYVHTSSVLFVATP